MRARQTLGLVLAAGGIIAGCESNPDTADGDHFEGVYSATLGADCAYVDSGENANPLLSITSEAKKHHTYYVMNLMSRPPQVNQSLPALQSGNGEIWFLFGEGVEQFQIRVKPHPTRPDFMLMTEWCGTEPDSHTGDALAAMLTTAERDYKANYVEGSPMPDFTNESLCLRKEPSK